MMTKGLWFPTGLLSNLILCILIATLTIAPARAEAKNMLENLVTLEVDNASLISVLQILTEKSGLNIVTGPSVEARTISLRIVDVPVEEALDLVVKAVGLGYEKIGNSIVIETPEVLGKDANLSSLVIQLDYADAWEVQDMLRDLYPHVQVDLGGNRLVIRASPKVRGEILNIIDGIDKPSQQVMLQAKLTEVSVDALFKLGIDWDKINSITTIVTEGKPAPVEPDAFPEEMPFEIMDHNDFVDKAHTIHRQLKAFEVVLDLLINEGEAQILADTKLATMNNREATIHIGDIIPYVVTTYAAGAGGVTEMAQVEKEKVGIKLKITPHVNDDGFIITKIESEVSSIVGFRGPNDEIPWVKTRLASTTVRVRDKETILIAGLLNEDETLEISKLPLLGHIPVLGKLFQHTVESKRKTDLIVEITPQVIKG